MRFIHPLFIFLLLCGPTGCNPSPQSQEKSENSSIVNPSLSPTLTRDEYGQTPEGDSISQYTLTHPAGIEAKIITYGAILTSLRVPDREGKMGEVILGYDNLAGYMNDKSYQGATVGRYGNRIARGTFTLDEETYSLATNNGENHLHGGPMGFNKVVWEAEQVERDGMQGVSLRYTSPDREEGFPGTLAVKVTYLLTDQPGLRIEYEATTDKPTIVNLTHHSYFNLKDAGQSPVLDHLITLNADAFVPVDETLIPTGELMEVAETPFDFRTEKSIGQDIGGSHVQLERGGGYDHCWAWGSLPADSLHMAARVREPQSGRIMQVWTTEPGIQFYSGNFLNGFTGRDGTVYQKRFGFCLEAQHYPDSPNQPSFPSVRLNPGEQYRTTTVYAFPTGD